MKNIHKRMAELLAAIRLAEKRVDHLYTITCGDIALSRALNDLNDLNIQYLELLAEIPI